MRVTHANTILAVMQETSGSLLVFLHAEPDQRRASGVSQVWQVLSAGGAGDCGESYSDGEYLWQP